MNATEHHGAPKAKEAKPGFKPIEEVFEAKTGSDLGKVALFVALLAFVLMVILYFSQQQNISGLAAKIDEAIGLKAQITAVKDQVGALEKEVAAIRNLTEEARKIIISGMISESASKMDYLISQVEDGEQQARLKEIRKMLQEVAAGI